MLRAIENPQNRFSALTREWDGPVPLARLQVYEQTAGRILSRNDSPDLPFRYSLNPYRGCTHACAYCYARPDHEFLGWGAGTDFDSRIVVKTNAAARLRAAFNSKSWQGELVMFSGDTDCYQPLEGSYGLTRACLEVCLEYRNPVGIITKSALVRRDIDLLVALCQVTSCHVMVSIPFLKAAWARALEPGAPAPRLRLDSLRRLSEAGVPCGVMLAPLIPGLNDRELPGVLEAAAEAGASTASMVLLRLPGAVQQVFEQRLRQALPLRAERIMRRLRETRGGAVDDRRFGKRFAGSGTYYKLLEDMFTLSCRRWGLGGAPELPSGRSSFRRPGPRQLTLFEED